MWSPEAYAAGRFSYWLGVGSGSYAGEKGMGGCRELLAWLLWTARIM